MTAANQQARTITIRVYDNGRRIGKYRTTRLSCADFEYYTEQATQQDWAAFLRTRTGEYYAV